MLLAQADRSIVARPAEVVLAESTAYCRESSRLMWIVLDWLMHHIRDLDIQRLLDETSAGGDVTVLGLLCDAAHQRLPDYWLLAITRMFKPHRPLEVFFRRVARSPFASRLASEHSLDVFRRWGYLSNELTYLHSPDLQHMNGG